jgi:hypothetical protein
MNEQLYGFSYTHWVGLIALTVFDILVMGLVWHAYSLMRRHLPMLVSTLTTTIREAIGEIPSSLGSPAIGSRLGFGESADPARSNTSPSVGVQTSNCYERPH